MVKVLL